MHTTQPSDVRFDHTVIPATDAERSATFFAEMFGLDAPEPAGPFLQVRLSDGGSSSSRSYPPASPASTSRSSSTSSRSTGSSIDSTSAA